MFESYRISQEACGIRIGDKVLILPRKLIMEPYWDNRWVAAMDNYIGKTGEVTYIKNDGLTVEFEDNWYVFPYFCLAISDKTYMVSLEVQIGEEGPEAERNGLGSRAFISIPENMLYLLKTGLKLNVINKKNES